MGVDYALNPRRPTTPGTDYADHSLNPLLFSEQIVC